MRTSAARRGRSSACATSSTAAQQATERAAGAYRRGAARHPPAAVSPRPSRRAAPVRMGRPVRLTILSRASDLARIQARLVARTLVDRVAGRRDHAGRARRRRRSRSDHAATAACRTKARSRPICRTQLSPGGADAVVHSWKDLPLEARPDTVIAATLERADPRDVLLVRRGRGRRSRPARSTS